MKSTYSMQDSNSCIGTAYDIYVYLYTYTYIIEYVYIHLCMYRYRFIKCILDIDNKIKRFIFIRKITQ